MKDSNAPNHPCTSSSATISQLQLHQLMKKNFTEAKQFSENQMKIIQDRLNVSIDLKVFKGEKSSATVIEDQCFPESDDYQSQCQ